jgi:hypothetical protein
MSIITTPSQIIIHKPSGDELFNSDNRIIYEKFSGMGTGNQTDGELLNFPRASSDDNEFVVAYITLTSCSNSLADAYLNQKVAINDGLIVGFKSWNRNNQAAAYTQALVLVSFSYPVAGYVVKQTENWDQTEPHTNEVEFLDYEFDWQATIYAYQ